MELARDLATAKRYRKLHGLAKVAKHMKKQTSNKQSQIASFRKAARELGCDESEETGRSRSKSQKPKEPKHGSK
jgi:hypothetical protein